MIITFSLDSFSQGANCNCDQIEINPENQYKCDTIIFENRAMLYWQWNCDSAWLTFENTKKLILKSCNEMNVYECNRTGLNFLKEYPNYLLFQYKWISGCCTPPDLIFLNKENGNELKRISNSQFIWGDIDENYALYFSDTTYTKLIYLDNNTDKEYFFQFDNEQVNKSVTKNQVLQLTDLFKHFKKDDNFFVFDFMSSNGNFEQIRIEIK